MEKKDSKLNDPKPDRKIESSGKQPMEYDKAALELDEWELEKRKERESRQGQGRAGDADTIGNP